MFLFFIFLFSLFPLSVFGSGEIFDPVGSGVETETIVMNGNEQTTPQSEHSSGSISGNQLMSGFEITELTGNSLSGNNQETPDGSSGSTTTSSSGSNGSGPFLFIQEIFPKDTDYYGEYVAVFFSQHFSGSVRIIGLGNGSAEKVFLVNVLTGQTVFFTDNPQKLTPSGGQLISSTSSITLTDTGEPLEVWVGTEFQDKVTYTQNSSTQALSCSQEQTAQGYRICNQFIVPSVLSALFSPLTGNNTTTSGNNTTMTGSLEGSTGTVYSGGVGGTGSQMSGQNTPQEGGPTQPIQPSPITSFAFRIEEIYPYESVFPEYIELLSLASYDGSITIGGLGQGSASKTVSITTMPGVRRILTNKPEIFSYYPFVIGVSSISLTNQGEKIDLILPNGQQIDSVVYSGLQEERSLILSDSSVSEAGVRSFSTPTAPTPGYVLAMIDHHLPKQIQIPVCGIHRQHTTPLFADKKLNVQAVVDGAFLQNSNTTYACEWLFSGSDTPYMSGCNPSYLGFTPGLWPVTLRISKNQTPLCEITQQLNLPSPKPLENNTKGVYYEGLYKKRKEKYDLLAKQIRDQGFTISLSGELKSKGTQKEEKPFIIPKDLLVTGVGPPTFQIHSVLPNPKGKDAEGERMLLENLTDELLFSDDLMLAKGSSSKGLPPGISFPPGELVELVGDIGLPNSPTCISLRFRKQKASLALFCYPQLAEDELFTGGMVGFESNEEQHRLQELSLLFTESESCVQIGGQEVLCKGLPYPISEAKQRKKDARKLISTTKKVATLQQKYDLRREKYASLSKNNKKRESALTLRNRELRTDIKIEKKSKNMFQGMYRLLRKKLGAEWTPLYDSPAMKQLTYLYEQLVSTTSTDTMKLGPVVMSPAQVDERYALYFEGKLPSAYIEQEEVVVYLADGRNNSIKLLDSFLVSNQAADP